MAFFMYVQSSEVVAVTHVAGASWQVSEESGRIAKRPFIVPQQRLAKQASKVQDSTGRS